jgi:putative component of toxin-antitoxin plasmid stabilization module
MTLNTPQGHNTHLNRIRRAITSDMKAVNDNVSVLRCSNMTLNTPQGHNTYLNRIRRAITSDMKAVNDNVSVLRTFLDRRMWDLIVT